MDKTTLLLLFNLPLVVFGMIRAGELHHKNKISSLGLIVRLGFWLAIGFGLFFAEEFYRLLVARGLTDSTPLSIMDVVLVTGVNLALVLIVRLYAKIDALEDQLNTLHENLSIMLSTVDKK